MNSESTSERLCAIEAKQDTQDARLARIEVAVEKIATRSQFGIGHVSVIITLLLALASVGTAYIQTVVGPIQRSVSLFSEDKRELQEAIKRVDEIADNTQSEMQSLKAYYDTTLKEIETQFNASDQVHNLQHATAIRNIAMLWEKSFGSHFPSEVQYYPNISQHAH